MKKITFGTIILAMAACGFVTRSQAAEKLATIGGEAVTTQELEKNLEGPAKGQYFKAQSEFFDAKKQALDSYLFQALVEKEAKKKGVSPESLVGDEIEKKVKKPSDRQAQKLYDDIKKTGRQLPPFERVKGQIMEKLAQDNRAERQDAYFEALKKKYDVAYHIDRPRLSVGTGSFPARGKEGAPITIVEFSDFQCPFCSRAVGTVEEVLDRYKGKVKVYFRDFPLSFHKEAKPAAVAARCGGKQGKFWEFHDALFAKQKDLKESTYMDIAKDLKLDLGKFEKCLKDPAVAKNVDEDQEAGAEVGVTGTPAFFINGIPLSGAVPFERFAEIIDTELNQKGGTKSSKAGQVVP